MKSLLPIFLTVVVALLVALVAIVYGAIHPPRRAYLVTPKDFSEISGPVLKATDQTWSNPDGTSARGWLLKGSEGAPAVVFLHRYGADRSWLLNLGVKVNETTGFTILWTDLRGHGLNPPVKSTAFGTKEGDDLLAAIEYLRRLKSDGGNRLVGNLIGIYGVELGAYTALQAGTRDAEIKVLVLDSVPQDPDELLRSVVKSDVGIDNRLLQFLTRLAAHTYFLGQYKNTSSCDLARTLKAEPKVLLLSGEDAGYLRDSTTALASCLGNSANVEVRTDLPLTGMNLPSATGEQGEGYDRRVIDFFDRNLR